MEGMAKLPNLQLPAADKNELETEMETEKIYGKADSRPVTWNVG